MSGAVRAEAHAVAQRRRSEGRPTWAARFDVSDVFHDDSLSVVEKGHRIAARMRQQPWWDEDNLTLYDVAGSLDDLDGLTEDEATTEFDGWWSDFYDWCDLEGRVWVLTRREADRD